MAKECEHLRRESGFFSVTYKCALTNEEVSDSHYEKWCSSWDHVKCVDYKEDKDSKSSSFCYLTTIVCNILGFADDVSYLQMLRHLRNDILQKDEQYKEVLATYDIVGPIIAKNLSEEEHKNQIALNLLNLGIKPVCELLELKKDKEAIQLYKDMTNILIQGYGITKEIDQDYIDNMDVENSGHGRLALIK